MKKPEDKRRPLLADSFLHRRTDRYEQYMHPKALDQLQRGIRNARKFVFDEEAAERLARVVMAVPDLLAREHEFARAPFDLTWIEYPSWKYWDTMREENDPAWYDPNDPFQDLTTSDHTVGFLIDHYRVNTFVGGTRENPGEKPMVSPLQYRLHTEWPMQDQISFVEQMKVSRLYIMQFMWGSSYDKLTHDQRRVLRDNTVIEHVPMNLQKPEMAEHVVTALPRAMRGAVGDVRTITAMLLMLNRPSITRYSNMQQGRGWYKARPIPFMSHTVVSVSLDAAETLKLIGAPGGEGVPKRRHEVQAHYCHDKTARDMMRIAGCLHEWTRTGPPPDWAPVSDDRPYIEVRNWVCAACGGRRWRRDNHGEEFYRGSAARGFVVHDGYDVTS